MLSGGCGDGESPAPPFPRATAVPDDPQATEDQAGKLACGALSAALRDGTLMAPGITDSIVASAGSADAPIADAARRLRAAHTAARSSQGSAEEPDLVAGVSVAGAGMLEVCDESGLKTAG